ncbi:MAG: sigma-70 family RNA polymerase sigma factor [Chitinophagaceae bacterium]|nr:sigma-70 family RNA polymerase sigma factor [Chitinophagaceae bacterium]MCW5928458.1 sigma-70 family RNA polymerase sigma factor [Chitinophagaceae bacterium]
MNPIVKIKEGSEFAFQQVYEEYYQRLYYYVLNKTSSEWMAEEATQITFIKLWQYRESLDERLSISLQIFRIAKTTLIDLIRKQNHLAAALNGLETNIMHTGDEGNTVIDYNEANKELMKAIAAMPPIRKQVFEMNRLKGMRYKEIAESLSISVKTVEKHMSRAIRQIKPLLKSATVIWYILKNF